MDNTMKRQGDWLFFTRPRTQVQGTPALPHAGGGLISASEVTGHSHVCTQGAAIITSPSQVVIRPVDGMVTIDHLDTAGQPCGHEGIRFPSVADDQEVVGLRQVQVRPDGLVEPSTD